ncbi:MAG: alpha/beta hydrolase [Actinobacteria bacterium]|nr:alpha/beta hydrolase [Actinomycetota bacterium]MCG2797500.1 alpha/beta hydrolase [Cellulomonas sp.]
MPTASTSSRRARIGLTGILALTLLAAGCTTAKNQSTVPTSTVQTAPSADLQTFYDQTLDWTSCDNGLQCADFTVPLDYADPSGATITIAVARSRASDPQASMVINPGGPGSSGIDLISSMESEVGSDVRRTLDIVGFDPRGVGQSTAVSCVSDAKLDEILAFDVDGATEAGRAAAEALFTQLGEGCLKRTGDLLGHVDTISSAKDMDVLRAVLGDETLTYLGFSYGTDLGATYAALFPARVGRLVLDGALDPTLTATELATGQAEGFENALRAYVTDCLTSSSCPLSGSVDEAMAQIGTLLDKARAHPMETGTDRALTGSLAFTGVALPLYAQSYWPALTDALTLALDQQDGSGLLQLSDIYSDRGSDGAYSTNSMVAFWSINCADSRDDADPDAMEAQAQEIKAVAPTVWKFFAYGALLCENWPTPAVDPLPSYAAAGAAPILVVGTTNDPATPYSWAQKLAETLDSGVLLTREGEGHTAYSSGNACIVKAVDAFLVDGTVPAEGTTC